MKCKPKGRKLSSEVLQVLTSVESGRLYSLSEAVKTVFPRDHAMYDVVYRRMANYLDKHFSPDKEGHPSRYFGKTLQSRLRPEDWGQVNEPIVKKPRWRGRNMWLLAFGLVLAGAGSATISRLDPLELLRTMGLGAAREAAYAKQAETPKELFSQAWVDFSDNKFDAATSKAFALLARRDTSPKMSASCFYLLGNIQAVQGQHDLALYHFELAYEKFGGIDSYVNLYLCALESAKALGALERHLEAREMLAAARIHYEEDQALAGKISHLGQFYLVNQWLAVREGDYEDALAFALKRYAAIEGIEAREELAEVYSDLGFWFTVNGCTETGMAFTNRAEWEINLLGDPRFAIWNQVNWILIQRSLGFEINQHILANIEGWSKIKGDSELKKHLELALKIEPKEYVDENCGSLRENIEP